MEISSKKKSDLYMKIPDLLTPKLINVGHCAGHIYHCIANEQGHEKTCFLHIFKNKGADC